MLKVDAELSILTNRTRKLLHKLKRECEGVKVEEAKGKEKCDDWLSTDGHRLVTTQHTDFEYTTCRDHDCCQTDLEKHQKEEQFHMLIDNRQTYHLNECSFSEDASHCRDGVLDSKHETRFGCHCNCCKVLPLEPPNAYTSTSENPRVTKKFENSIEFHSGRCSCQKHHITPLNSKRSKSSTLDTNESEEFETAKGSLSSIKKKHSESAFDSKEFICRKLPRKDETRGSSFIECRVRKSVSFTDQMLNRKTHFSMDEDVFLSPQPSHSESFMSTRDISFCFSPGNVQSPGAFGNLSSISVDLLKYLDMDNDEITDELPKISKIYTGRHSISIKAADCMCLSPPSSLPPTRNSSSDGRLSDQSDFRTCSTCSCMYLDDINNDLHLDRNIRNQIDHCSERIDYMYHIAPVDVYSDDVWRGVGTSDDECENSTEQLISAYQHCDTMYRMASENSEFALGDNLQYDGNYQHMHSVQANMVVLERGDSPLLDPSQMSISVELACNPPVTEVITAMPFNVSFV